MATRFYELIDFVRVQVGDLDKSVYTDDTLLTVLRVTTGFLALLGYDKSYTTDFNQISQDLSEKEKSLWGKAAAVLLRNPKALSTAADAISIRTEEVSYSTNVGASLIREITQADLQELRSMIFAQDDPMVARRPDYGLQLGLDSPYSGTDVISD